ncbi:MAG: hypothetical protein KC731_33635, partial [Myxococcales bacterium]|nr:hypothetical protein [Myxococcales bacterium]
METRVVVWVGVCLLVGCGSSVVLEGPATTDGDGGTASPATSSSTGGGAPTTGSGGAGGNVPVACEDWRHILGGDGANWLRGQAVGPDGSVAVTVDSTAGLSFDGTPLDVEPGLVVVKLGPSGDLEWARRFGQSSQGPTMPVAFDAAGNLFVGGIGFQSAQIGDLTISQPGSMGYVAKLAPDGTPLWAQSWGVPIESGGIADLTLDAAGNVYFQGAVGFEEPVVWGSLVAEGTTFVGKIFADGTPAWLRGFDGAFVERRPLGVAPNGHLVIGETLQGAGSFDGIELSSVGGFDILSFELDPDGQVVDAQRYGDDALQRASGFAVGPAGTRTLIGINWGILDFGAGAVGSSGDHEVFLAQFDASGTNTWTKSGSNDYAPSALAGTADGGVALVISSQLAAAFGCGSSESDLVLVELDPLGQCTL